MVRPYKKINMDWSGDLAYVIGIITADGNLSPSRRHISITSKDKQIVQNCKEALGIDNTIGRKGRGGTKEKNYFVLQFGSVIFYSFLEDIGLKPNKSKTIKSVEIPSGYFADFLRGYIDGDGTIVQFMHPESNNVQLRLSLVSASEHFIIWFKKQIKRYFHIKGGWISDANKYGKGVYTLSFGKKDSIKLLKYVYNTDCRYKLDRKYNIASKYIDKEK